MTTPPPTPTPPPETPSCFPLAAFLSYLVPGLGQLAQGRIAKGLFFFVCLYGLFFTGMAMGDWKNVYIVNTAKDGNEDPPWENNGWHLPRGVANLYNRMHYVGQFWIGVAAWPALLQYNHIPLPGALKDVQRQPTDTEMNEFLANSDKTPDVGWVYTIIAGVLNILVIYDAFAGPALARGPENARANNPEAEPATSPPAEVPAV